MKSYWEYLHLNFAKPKDFLRCSMKEILFPFIQEFLSFKCCVCCGGWGSFNPFWCTSGALPLKGAEYFGVSMAVPSGKNKAGAWVFIVKIEALSPGCLIYQSTWILFNQHLRKFDIPGLAKLPWDSNLELTVDQVWPQGMGESSAMRQMQSETKRHISSLSSSKLYPFFIRILENQVYVLLLLNFL